MILAVAAAYFVYNAGYWLPFGGGTPGPRFLIPMLPFLALGLAVAWRRWPGADARRSRSRRRSACSRRRSRIPLIGEDGDRDLGRAALPRRPRAHAC